MLFLFGIVAFVIAATAIVGNSLRKAPLGFEDERGFHMVQRIRGSGVMRSGKGRTAAATLKGARAHT